MTVLIAATASIIVHTARATAEETASSGGYHLLALAIPSPSDKPPQLPVLPPAVEAITRPHPDVASAAASPVPQAPVRDPAALLASAAAAPASPSQPAKERVSRAQALPEVPLAAGSSRADAPAAANTGPPKLLIANTLDSQFVEHTIIAGESLSTIAAGYGITITSIVANNPGLGDLDIIHTGQTLRIPTTNGLLYHVQAGDTLDGISKRYGVPLQDVIGLSANGLANADIITPGQTILLPGDIKPPPPPVFVRALPAASSAPPSASSLQDSASSAAAPTPAVPVARFIWPVQGPITQGFGVPELGVGAPHTGIDIGLYGRNGAPILAAAPGTVSFSGGDSCCGYGYYVIIKHAGGLSTLYGHLSRRSVSVGDTVTQGQTVGLAGSTGFSTGTHLHFEILVNGSAQNPMRYLP